MHILYILNHWGWMMHICVSEVIIIGSDNGLSSGRRQAIIWTNVGILLTGPLGTNFSEILIGIKIFSFKKMLPKMSSAKWRPFCLRLNVLNMKMPVVACSHKSLLWTGQYSVCFPSSGRFFIIYQNMMRHSCIMHVIFLQNTHRRLYCTIVIAVFYGAVWCTELCDNRT